MMRRPHKPTHWSVRLNYRNRTGSFILAFATIGVHLHDQEYGPIAWVLIALQFLVYPHLAYWRARWAPDPRRAELDNLLLDAVLFGICVAALGFPIWISFMLLVSATINRTAFRGVRSVIPAVAAIAGGALVGVMFAGLHFTPDTSGPTTALAIASLTAYLIVVADATYQRSLDLHRAREQLREEEQARKIVNERLRQQIDDIYALEARLRDQAHRDPLTGLYNRRFFDASMERELTRCQREQLPLSLMLIDVDRFKRINDTHGHAIGDIVLNQLAHLLDSHSRELDVICRYGGDEFVLLMPNMPHAAAQARAQMYRETFAQMRVDVDGMPASATLSAGVVTSHPGFRLSASDLLRHADEAMYRAKNEGRNRVEVHADESAAPA